MAFAYLSVKKGAMKKTLTELTKALGRVNELHMLILTLEPCGDNFTIYQNFVMYCIYWWPLSMFR